MEIHTEQWGLMPYDKAWKKQEMLFKELVDSKMNRKQCYNRLIFVEHPNVYTIGRNGKDSNLLVNESFLHSINAQLYHIDRGGDITYHGPGQIVCYPIINIEEFHLSLREYIHILEQAVMNVCAEYNVSTMRKEGATGVWLDVDRPTERKICAIGVRCSHFITMHGLAFNINTDLNYFNYINPCGFKSSEVTSLKKELGKEMDIKKISLSLEKEIRDLLCANIQK